MIASSINAITRLFAGQRSHATEPPAQDTTPEPATWEKTPYLFAQSFQGGSLAANSNTGTHTLTLEQGLGQMVYFSDRPARDVGILPTPDFLSGLGFPGDNPPNAALLVEAGEGATDIAVLEPFEPTYDVSTHTATYQVRGLEAWEDSAQLGLQQEPADLSGITPVFGAAHLLIDACGAAEVICYVNDRPLVEPPAVYFCWYDGACMPCDPFSSDPPDVCAWIESLDGVCNHRFADWCQGGCYAVWDGSDAQRSTCQG